MSILNATTKTGLNADVSRGQARAMAAVGILAKVRRTRPRSVR